MSIRNLLLVTTVLFSATHAFAKEAKQTPPVVVVATRTPTPLSQIGSSVTVIGDTQIEERQLTTLPDALNDVPGVNLVQTGGLGGKTSLFTRGANANHTKVLLDGIDIADPTVGSFDLGQFLTADVERIEVLRGPQSGLYGANAIGGVVNIITKKGQGPAQFTASAEAGSFATFNQHVGVSGGLERFSYRVGMNHLHAGSTPVTPKELLFSGDRARNDSYDNKTYSTKLGAQLADNLEVGLVAHYVDTALDFTASDNVNFGYPDPVQSTSNNNELFTRATVRQTLWNGTFDHTLGVGFTDYHRMDVSPGYFNISRGDRLKFDWQGNVKLAPGQIVTIGADRETEAIRHSPVSADTTTNAGFVQLQSNVGERFFNTLSARYDHNDNFGGKLTYRIAPAYLIVETGTKLKASLGSGFKAPNLTDLFVDFPAFSYFSNPNLQPEQSTGYDVGLEQMLFKNRVKFGVTYYRNRIKDLIAVNDAGTTSINISRATTYGLENFISYAPVPELTFRADYTYGMATNDRTEQQLLRRPKNKASLNATWNATHALTLSATLIHVGSWTDVNRSFTIPRFRADGFTTVNIAASYDINERTTLYGRIDNLLDRDYENPVGFLQPGIGAYAGVKTTF